MRDGTGEKTMVNFVTLGDWSPRLLVSLLKTQLAVSFEAQAY
jgi:hypothetical protein